MRRFTMVQDIGVDLDEHWRLFLDDDFERDMYLKGFGFPKYEVVESRTTDKEIFRKLRVTPKLDLPGPVAKLLGSSFGYVEEGTFDRVAKTFASHQIPNVLADRLKSDARVRAEATGEGRCRRTIDLSVEARIFGIGGLVESAIEKNMRSGWENSAAYMNREAKNSPRKA
jgi:uncharacterized protein DUF2505